MSSRETSDSLSAPDIRSAAVRGIRWTLIARPIVECALFGSLIVLARLIPPAEFGRYAVALVFGELMLIPGQAVGAALVQRPNIASKHLQTGVALAVLIGVAIAGIMLIAATVVVAPVFDERTAELVRLSTLSCLLNSTNIVPSAVLQRGLAFRRLGIIDVVSTLVTVGASLAFALAGANAVGLVLGGFAGVVASTILLWSFALPPLPRLRREPARDLAAYGFPAAVAAIGWVGFRNCDYAIVGARLGALQAGFYFRAYTLGVEYQKKVGIVMGSVGFPLLARAQSGEQQQELRRQMVRLLTVVLFPALALLAVVAPVFVPWLFGPKWAPAVVPTQILVVGGAVTLVIDVLGAVLMAAGRTRALAAYGWGHFIAYAGAVVIVSPLGIAAVAVAAATVHSAFLLIAYALVAESKGQGSLRLSGVLRELWSDVAPATVPCAALVAATLPVAYALSGTGIPVIFYVAAVSVAGIVAYFGVMRARYPASLRSLVSLARQIFPRPSVPALSRRVAAASTPPVS